MVVKVCVYGLIQFKVLNVFISTVYVCSRMFCIQIKSRDGLGPDH